MSLKKHATRGRPPLPRDIVCDQRVVTFLNDGVRRRVAELAARNGSSVSQTCRDLIVRAIELVERENDEEPNLQEGTE